MRTRLAKRLQDESDRDLPIPSLPSRPHVGSTRKLKWRQPLVTTISGDSSFSDESNTSPPSLPPLGTSQVQKRRRVKESTPRSPSISVIPLSFSVHNVPENFFKGHNFEIRFKSSICEKSFVYEKTIDMYYYQNSSSAKPH